MSIKENKTTIVYLLITYPIKKEEYGTKNEVNIKSENTQKVFMDKIENDNFNHYITVFQYNYINPKKKNVSLEFIIENNKQEKEEYKIKFDYNFKEYKEVCFIYNLNLSFKKGFSNDKAIVQNLDYTLKMNYYIKALIQTDQKNRLNDLYNDTIELYSKHPKFEFLINIFINVYENKTICPKLLEQFKNFNLKLTSRINDPNSINIDFKYSLNEYINIFQSIIQKAEELIKTNAYNSIDFYGLIFCYTNNYDYENFAKLFYDLAKKEDYKKEIFEILLIYNHFFKNKIKFEKDFLKAFINYAAENNDTNNYFRFIEKALPYLDDVNLYLNTININKDKIILIEKFKPIEITDFDNYSNNFDELKSDINEILNFSESKEKLLIYFNYNFWSKLKDLYERPSKENIIILSELRTMFEKYYKIVEKTCKIKTIIEKAKEFHEKDELSYKLDESIRKYIEEKDDIQNDDIVNLIMQYNPFYFEKGNINKRKPEILEKIDLEKIDIEDTDENFIKLYRDQKFEKVFEQQIDDYILIFIPKITKFSHFIIVLKLLNIEDIGEKKHIFIELLEQKYEYLVKDIPKLSNESLKEKEVKTLINNLSSLLYFFYKESGLESLKKKIKILCQNTLIVEIYINLYKLSTKDEDIDVKIYINDFFFKDLKEDKLKDLSRFLENLEKKEDYLDIMEKIGKNYIINESDYFSTENIIKIKLLFCLKDNGLLKEEKENNYFLGSKQRLEKIYNDIEGNKLNIKQLNLIAEEKEEDILKRLELLNLTNKVIKPKNIYNNLIKQQKEISENILILENILNSLVKFHSTKNKNEIDDIREILEKVPLGTVEDYHKKKMKIEKLKAFKSKADKINEVINDDYFKNVCYKSVNEADEDVHFDNAFEIYNKMVMKSNDGEIQNLMVADGEKTQINFQSSLIKKGNTRCSNPVNIKKYEKDINSLFYFFDNFPDKTNDKWKEFLSEDYKNLSQKEITKIDKYLKELLDKGIYDANKKENYMEFFTSFTSYNYKKEIYNFLMSSTTKNIKYLYEKIEPNNKRVTIKDIHDTYDCVGTFEEIKKLQDNFQIFDYIKKLDDETINKFKSFSRVYPAINELNQNYEFSNNLYDEIKNIVNKADFTFNQDKEYFKYYDSENKECKITLLKLNQLNNKIHIKKKDKNKTMNANTEDEKNYEEKCKILIIFKEIVKNIKTINKYMEILRLKGSSLPIIINININYPKVEYFLASQKTNFEDIQEFLCKAKNYIINKLDELYKKKSNLRFIYGKQFKSILKHLNSSSYKIDNFLRYILNNTNNSKQIEEGYIYISRKTSDYVHEYELFNENSFDNISDYISSIFKNNGLSYEKHYDRMIIKNNNTLKGLYLYESNSEESMEVEILNIFLENTGNLPIAQNILISNKETSYEEMQSFFNRSILCKFNTLFIVEINNSFSNSQRKIMNNFIDKLLTYKNKIFNENEEDHKEKNRTNEYMDSCLVFIYKSGCNDLFLNEIQKLNPLPFPRVSKKYNLNSSIESEFDYNQKNLLYENTHIISSEICGLGKTTKIKNEIYAKKKKYIYFPLGGNLKKYKIYKKLNEVLENINLITKKNFNDIAIHLDLYETDDISILNEFMFSILITKFYSNNENILYIPKNIEIYIEIPNCFNDFLAEYEILKSFNIINITLDEIPPLKLPKRIIKIFRYMKDFQSDEEIMQFIRDNIGTERYSYHQINIFINLFISQYSKFNSKLEFLENEKDVTDRCIKDFSGGTKYFTLGEYSKLLTQKGSEKNKLSKKSYLQKIETIYNDLKLEKYSTPLIFTFKEKKKYYNLYLSDENLNKFTKSSDYLYELKEIILLDNPVEKDENSKLIPLTEIINKDNYIITNDNFRKMVLILYRVMANIPVILMGETGCGKTSLIIKLNQLLNNGVETLIIININPSINDKFLIKKMKEINNIAENSYKGKILWIFFDELNTCDSMALLTEIFINRSFNGNKLNENIRIIGACNPYREKKLNKIKSGLQHPDDEKKNKLIYLVNLLPQSLFYYVFNFGGLEKTDEEKYISSIISKLFKEGEEKLKELTEKIIITCHDYLKETFDPSVVSLREISRFTKCCEFFMNKYYKFKNKTDKIDKLDKLKSIIISVYLCYYIRLVNDTTRKNFDRKLQELFVNLVNYEREPKKDNKNGDLLFKLDKDFSDYIENEKKIYGISEFDQFSQILTFEEKFLLSNIEIDKGIGTNKLLRENIFLLFVCLVTKIPLIIIGKPGSGKSLSAQLIYKSMRGKFSNEPFFQNFPIIIQSYFQGSYSTNPEDVENIFQIAEKKLKKNEKGEDLTISMILFDELGLAERAISNPLKVLHSKLECRNNKNEVSFIGISNWSLDAAKINRALSLSVPDLEDSKDDIKETSICISKSINEEFKNNLIFNSLLPTIYFEYKNSLNELKQLTVYKDYELYEFNKYYRKYFKGEEDIFKEKNLNFNENINFEDFLKCKRIITNKLKEMKIYPSWIKENFKEINEKEDYQNLFKNGKKINVDFHGNRDFYYLIRGVANEIYNKDNISKDKVKITEIIEKYIERNFGGMDIEIDIDTEMDFYSKSFENIEKLMKNLNYKKEKIISSVEFMKIIFNICSEKELNVKDVKKYDISNTIINNINDYNCRYSLLEIQPSLAPLIHQNLLKQAKREKISFYEGSPFANDINNEYQFKMINIIQEHALQGDVIILQNLEQIYAFLYDMFNMNFIINEGKKFARICHGNYNDQLVEIHERFKCIIMVDKQFVNRVDSPFLSRFEKTIISFDKLLDKNQKELDLELRNNDLNLTEIMKRTKEKYNLNINLEDLLIGCKNEDIQGLIYYFSNGKNIDKDKEDIKQKIFDKIAKLLPQDVIINLPNSNMLKISYFNNEHFYKLKDYLKKYEIGEINYKISIIYTFSSSDIVIGDNEHFHMISEIQSEQQMEDLITEKLRQSNTKENQNQFVFLQFEVTQSSKLSFLIPFAINNYPGENLKFIFIIHVKRSIDDKKINISNVIDVYPNVNQLFIDNLTGEKIALNDILDKSIKDILEENNDDITNLFNKVLKKFINKNLSNDNFNLNNNLDINIDNYEEKLKELFNNKEKSFMNDILEKAKLFTKGTGKDIIEKIYRDKYINKNSADIISVIKEYISEIIFENILMNILEILEDNNFLTTLLVSNTKKEKLLSEKVIKEIKLNQLKDLKIDNYKTYYPRFNLNFIIPGFYLFYEQISSFITDKIIGDYRQNENKIRYFLKGDVNDLIKIYHNKEKALLNLLYQEMIKYNWKFNLIKQEKIKLEIVLNDYITFYLIKYNCDKEILNNISSIKLINIMLNLRFNETKEIFLNNKDEPIKKFLLYISWLEANKNNIFNILKIYSILSRNFSSDIFFNNVEETINSKKIKYITNEDRNPKHTKEVNESFYIILASMCLSILPPKIKIDINNSLYFKNLSMAIKSIQYLDDHLLLFLNELYILDEINEIYNVISKNSIANINNFLFSDVISIIINNNEILLSMEPDKYEKLSKTFRNLYQNINKIINYENTNYYELLNYIYFKEIRKISDLNYRTTIFEYLIKENEIIVNSMKILQILMKKLVNPKKDKFMNSIVNILNNDDDIEKLMENILKNEKENNYLSLSETLLYFFEKNSRLYLENVFKDKIKCTLDQDPLEFFLNATDYLLRFIYEPKKIENKNNINICKLFCIAYIKIFCHTFIILINNGKKDLIKDISKIIKQIKSIDSRIIDKNNKNKNTNDYKLIKTIKLYIYKVIYNLNNKQFEVFLRNESILKYKLKEYDFDEFNSVQKIDLFNYRDLRAIGINDNENYEHYYRIIDEYKTNNFENVDLKDFELEKYGIDILFFTTSNLISSCIDVNNQFKASDLYINFYKKVLVPLFKNYDYNINKVFNALQIFYDPDKFETIQNEFFINSSNIKILLFSYRWCLNEIYSLSKNFKKNNNNSTIYSIFYLGKKYFENIKQYYYPGNDIDNSNPIYNNLLSKIVSHFSGVNAKRGCYVCLSGKGWYHNDNIIKDNIMEIRCKDCQKILWKEENSFMNKKLKPQIEQNYLRIFKDEKEEEQNKKFLYDNPINHLTIDKFKEKYIKKYLENGTGVSMVDEENFKKTDKIIRNLSQVSYRLLNFILFSHLFFARLYTENIKFDSFLPKNISWVDMITKCWELLKEELYKKKINKIELFMDYIFYDLFDLLNKQPEIKEYKIYINFEEQLENLIINKINEYIKEKEKYEKIRKPNINDPFLPINLLEEIYEKSENYPLYEYFYYSNYLNEKFIFEKLNNKEYRKYPVINEYLKNINNNEYQFMSNLSIFNEILNLFREKYSCFIAREDALKIVLKDDELYKNNTEKVEKFIKFYNSLEINKKKKITLSNENKLFEFFIDDSNPFGQSYIDIYNKFIELQNKAVEPLLNIKIENDIFDPYCKKEISIQNVQEDEIFSLCLPQKQPFIDIIFNNSYRKYALNNDRNSVNQYEINFEQIEENMTEILLKNKKLFNKNISKFIYKNEDLNFENIDILYKFNKLYDNEELILDDKFILYNYYNENKENINLLKNITNDFKTLLIFLIKFKTNDKNNDEINLNEKSKIFEVFTIIQNELNEKNFKFIFKDKDITINKLSNIFVYFLILIYPTINRELLDYREEIPEDKIKQINIYFNEKHLITKENLSFCIRMFCSSFLSEIKDKEKKIKKNTNNFVNYLDIPDIWEKYIYTKNEFKEELDKIKNLKIKLNEIPKLLEIIGYEFNENYFLDITKELKKREEEKLKVQQEKENIEIYNKSIENKEIEKKEEQEQEGDDEDIYARNDNDNVDEDDRF